MQNISFFIGEIVFCKFAGLQIGLDKKLKKDECVFCK
jgi:hypothetical protein